ncbi:MAG: hypothetical protein KI790_12910 [Cyclobacteriaceae bacterium]|nr:hypothetical protein [Cyclobacteriaceae bacterium HetDA_MAG_MS6]
MIWCKLNIVLLGLAISTGMRCWSQTLVGSYPAKQQVHAGFFLEDQANINSYLILQSKESLLVVTFDPFFNVLSRKLLKKYEIPGYRNELSWIAKNNVLYAYYSSGNKRNFASVIYDLITAKISEYQYPVKLGANEYLTSFSLHNFYIIQVPQSHSEFLIHEFELPHSNSLRRFSFRNIPRLHYEIQTQLPVLKLDAKVLKPSIDHSIDLTSYPVKVYPDREKITISVDARSHTSVFELILDKGEGNFFQFPKEKLNSSQFSYSSNSLIFENHLLEIVNSSTEMIFSVKSYPENLLIQSYFFDRRDVYIPFSNGQSRYNGDKIYISSGGNQSPKRLLKMLIKGSAGMVAHYDSDNNIEVTFGSIIESQYSGGGFIPGTPGTTIATPYGPVTTAGTPGYFNGGYSYSVTKTSNFRTRLERDTWNHIPGTLTPTPIDQVAEFEEEQNMGRITFRKNSSIHLGYWDEVNKVYKIFRFD